MQLENIKNRLTHIYQQKEYDSIGTYIKQIHKETIRTRANQLLEDCIVFDKPWDMECCLKPYPFMGDFNHSANGDEEWCFMLNRMDYLDDLMIAGIITQDNKYFHKVRTIFLDWIRSHTQIQREPSTRTLDTGIRVLNMVETLPILVNYKICSDNELAEIISSIKLQIHYLKESYISKYKLSNWGSIQTTSILCTMPFIYEDYLREEIFQWALKEVVQQFQIQVYDDGMLWEQSTMYHVEVAIYGMKLIYYSSLFDFKLSCVIYEKTKSLCNSLLYLSTPKHEIDSFGDSDVVCVADVLSCASVIFKEEYFAIGEYIEPNEAYRYGALFASSYQKTKKNPKELVFDGMDSGMYTTRSSWCSQASFTSFFNGSLGSGHGHCDNLHFSIYYKGKPILIDSGRYTYREDEPLRVKLKGMKAHNSLIVDDIEPCLPKDSWTYQFFSNPLKTYVKHQNQVHYYEGAMVSKGNIWIRKMIVIDPSIWVIVDEDYNEGTHIVKSYYHLDPDIIYRKNINDYLLNDDLQFVRDENSHIEKMYCSKKYNELSEQDVIVYDGSFTNNYHALSCLCDKLYNVKQVDVLQDMKDIVADDLASSIQIEISKKERYTIVVFHKEVYQGKKIFLCDGIAFHAKCIIIHTKDDKQTLFRMKT